MLNLNLTDLFARALALSGGNVSGNLNFSTRLK
jgi:hypothetical protein